MFLLFFLHLKPQLVVDTLGDKYATSMAHPLLILCAPLCLFPIQLRTIGTRGRNPIPTLSQQCHFYGEVVQPSVNRLVLVWEIWTQFINREEGGIVTVRLGLVWRELVLSVQASSSFPSHWKGTFWLPKALK